MTGPNLETYINITGDYDNPRITYVSRAYSREGLEADIGMIIQVDNNFRSYLRETIPAIRYAKLDREWYFGVENGEAIFEFRLLTSDLDIREPLSNWVKSLTEIYNDGSTRLLEHGDWVIEDCTFSWDQELSGFKRGASGE